MKKSLILSLAVIFATTFWWLASGGEIYNQYNLRKIIYPIDSDKTQYPGSGKVVRIVSDKIMVLPPGEGRESWDVPANRDKYEASGYKVYELPAQERVAYVVGRVLGWENIENAEHEKYLRLETDQGEISVRVATAPMIEYGFEVMEPTYIGIERVMPRTESNQLLNIEESDLAKLSTNGIEKYIRHGDVVVVLPVFAPPQYSRVDDSGALYVDKVWVRRAGESL